MSSVSLPTSTFNHSVILNSIQDLRAHRVSLFNRQLSPEVPKILDSYYIASSMTGCGELYPYMGKGGQECLLKHFISASISIASNINIQPFRHPELDSGS
ncbi:hypothetical protein AB4347_09830 [Vibrio breoganii]|uniref:Uncharacterized protein n=4 Tax=Vibrio breoganii TaxID=553239 RepID=A0ABX1UDW3_9VIBR|nr:hypothetical protein [Vibrio breoganii]NMO74839.1 hypothetical protein [Vibrio breoganii]NMR71341.1 hypothetical protein [Vibrio breoganii]